MNPHDAAIRSVLIGQLRAASPSALLVQEYDLGDVRADVAVLDDTLDVYEIKSAHDSLARLPKQAEEYGRIFDRCVAVVAPRHLLHVVAAVPAWWGIIAADDGVLLPARSPARNPTQEPRRLAWLLWQREALALARENGCMPSASKRLYNGNYRSKGALSTALATLPIDTLRAGVIASLRARPDWRLDDGRSVLGERLRQARAGGGQR